MIDVSSTISSEAVWSGGSINNTLKSTLEAGFDITANGQAAPGSVNWSYSVTGVDLDFLGENKTISLTYNVVITDNEGGTDSDDVTITITGTNDKPIIDLNTIDSNAVDYNIVFTEGDRAIPILTNTADNSLTDIDNIYFER